MMNLVDFDFSGFDALIFDMDGTLVDNMKFHLQAWPIWARREGLLLADEEILSRTHGTISDIVARFFPDKFREERFQIGERKEALYRELYAPHLRLLPGCADLLNWARDTKMPIALATAGDATNIAFTLDGLGIASFFVELVGGEDVSLGKPDPQVFLLAAQKMKVAPEKCLVFEDSPAGVEAARRAGMKCIVVNAMAPREMFGDTSHVVKWARDYREIAHNPWQTVSSRKVYENPWIAVREDEVIRPDGKPGIYGAVSMKNFAVGVVPLHDDGTVTLVGQFRYTMNEYSWEIPEGGCPFGESLLDCARRELLEETGLIPQKMKPLGGEIHLSNSVSDERAYLFLATGLVQGEARPEGTEKLAVRRVKLEDAVEMALRGEIRDGLSVLALVLTRENAKIGNGSL
ncbi:HAD-IA family hydrolase [Abditibacterium utsteinense]|nr:HAD-IA family hydrolase [Abditibacterium utsteinense]